MAVFKDIEEARAFFHGDRFATVNGMTIDELPEDGAVCSMTVRDDHRNAIGGVMGGVIYTLADFAYAVAANNEHRPTVALDAATQFLRMAQGSRLIARARRVKSGKTTAVYTVTVTDDLGREIALTTVTGYKL